MKRKIGRLIVVLLALILLACWVYVDWQITNNKESHSGPVKVVVTMKLKSTSTVKAAEAKEADVEVGVPVEQNADADVETDATDESATQSEDAPADIPSLASAYEIELIARTIWGEAGGIKNTAEQAAVAWCILNRVDRRGQSIDAVVLEPNQFWCVTWEEIPDSIYQLAQDVVFRWERERAGYENVGRTLPAEYEYFTGDGIKNYFTAEWQSTNYWDWSLPDPYTDWSDNA
jgi:hypothetical protein